MRIPQSTAIRVVMKGYLSADHVSAATGLDPAVTISKNGAAFANPEAGATVLSETGSGWYYVDLSSVDIGTLGPLVVRATHATMDDIEVEHFVVNANTMGAAYLDASVTSRLADADYTAPDNVSITAILADTGELQTNQGNWLTATSVTVSDKTGFELAANQHVIVDSGTVTDLTNAPVTMALESTLTGIKGATFDTVTDSLEALRDRGDSAWITATGFATPTNITAGTITNLTNAPTNGDLTAAMIASVTAAATAATPTAAGVSGLVVANLDAAVSTRLADVDYTPPDNAGIADIPTVAEFEARTILAADYVVVTDTIAGVNTCTTNLDMRGTDNAMPATEDGASFTALNDISTADVLAQVQSALNEAFVDSTSLATDGIKDRLRILGWLLKNKMTVNEDTGDTVFYKDDGTTPAFTVTAMFTSVADVTTRKRAE